MTDSVDCPPRRRLFEAVGIELEYMIVDAESLDVRPIAESVLRDEAGAVVSDLEFGDIAWSNELVAHVIELKTDGPALTVDDLAAKFQQHVEQVNRRLAPHGACLLPTAMHPWMDPHAEMVLWPHESGEIYETFNRIFDCRGHGWANLQSMHINLPFANDQEFGKLQAAVRLILPLLPALAASSPFMDAKPTGLLDSRLDVYRNNSRRIPSVAGRVIPEPAFDEATYEERIFEPMFTEIAPHDPDGVLRHEFLNARGAIARFSRGTIEIRVIDVQECPLADLAIAAAVIGVLKLLVEQTWTDIDTQKAIPIDPLERVFLAAIRDAELAVIDSPELLRHFGMSESRLTLSELWRHLCESITQTDHDFTRRHSAIDVILNEGPLARRIVKRLPESPSREELRGVYEQLANCLATGTQFR
ncbi:MAG: hypothetical protein KDA93_05530 [Planctomycetaceae bacterium]|nr:hypothetical protein [Planctomycetaceae bacterium]